MTPRCAIGNTHIAIRTIDRFHLNQEFHRMEAILAPRVVVRHYSHKKCHSIFADHH